MKSRNVLKEYLHHAIFIIFIYAIHFEIHKHIN